MTLYNMLQFCIPKYSCVKDIQATKKDFEDHILVPVQDSDDHFTSESNHVSDRYITLIQLDGKTGQCVSTFHN